MFVKVHFYKKAKKYNKNLTKSCLFLNMLLIPPFCLSGYNSQSD